MADALSPAGRCIASISRLVVCKNHQPTVPISRTAADASAKAVRNFDMGSTLFSVPVSDVAGLCDIDWFLADDKLDIGRINVLFRNRVFNGRQYNDMVYLML